MQGAGDTLAAHDLEPVGTEVGDQQLAIARKGQAVGQCSLGELGLEVLGLLDRSLGKARIGLLAYEALRAIGSDAGDAAARIGGPERAVALGQDALGTLQVLADIADLRAVHREAVKGIGLGHRSNTRLMEGKAISTASTTSMASVKGAVPLKISPRVMSTVSPGVLLIT